MRWSVLLLVLALAACRNAAPQLREHTYPPSFEYVERSRVQSSMWMLAFEVNRLDRTLRQPAEDPAVQQRQVAEILSLMDGTLDRLVTPGRVTQHPLLNRNLPRFREQIRHAREGVARTPPNYFIATTLVGACSGCHGGAET